MTTVNLYPSLLNNWARYIGRVVLRTYGVLSSTHPKTMEAIDIVEGGYVGGALIT